MKAFSNILVGVDFSQASKNALAQAGRVAGNDGTTLNALHVIVPSEVERLQEFYTIPSETMRRTVLGELETTARNILGEGAAVNCDAVFGLPVQQLKNYADEHDCDLLILGSQRDTDHPNGVGFFASKCARTSSIPVLLTRMEHDEKFKKVVACVDFSEETPTVLAAAAQVASEENAELHVIHAVKPPWLRVTHALYNAQTIEDDAYKAQFRELLNSEMEAACRSLPVPAEKHVIEHEYVGQALIDFLKSSNCDLAVVGRSGHTGKVIRDFFLGSTAERVIQRSPCSVLVVPPSKKQ